MRSLLKTSRALGLGAIFSLTAGLAFAQQPNDPKATFNRDCAEIGRFPHRLTGTAEYRQAADYIERRLRAIVSAKDGDQVIVQPFDSAQIVTPTVKADPNDRRNDTIVKGQDQEATATLTAPAGKTIRLHPMRPNGIIPPATPRGGISGNIVYLGRGDAADFNRINVKDAIVVLNYNSGQGFIRAFRLGAKAIVFTRGNDMPEKAMSSSPHFADCNVNLMRYYFDGTAAQLKADCPENATVAIDCKLNWGYARGRNVYAYIKGTNAKFDPDKRHEVIVLAANLDTFGEVPNLTPGARGAANAAALLRLAEHIVASRPRRDVVIAFFDQQARGHVGVSHFYQAIEDKKDNQVTDRRLSFRHETNFMRLMDEQLADASPLTKSSDVRKKLLDKLEVLAQTHAYYYKNEAYEKRERLNQRKKAAAAAGGVTDELRKEEQELNQLIASELEPKKMAWNEVQRTIGREKRKYTGDDQPLQLDPDLSEQERTLVNQFLAQVLDEARRDYDVRKEELKREDEALAADESLYDIFYPKALDDQGQPILENEEEGVYARDPKQARTIVLHASLLLGDTTRKWAIIIGGDSSIHSGDDNQGLYGKVRNAFLNAYKAIAANATPNADVQENFLVESADQKLNQTRVIWAAPRLVHSGEMAGVLGYFNLALGTVQEATLLEGTPDDTFANVSADAIYAQVRDIERFFAPAKDFPEQAAADMLGNQEGLSLNKGFPTNKEYFIARFDEDNNTKGPTVMGMLPGTSTPNTPLAGAIVQLRLSRNFSLAYAESKFVAFDNYQVHRTDANGHYNLGPLNGRTAGSWGGFAAVFRPEGNLDEVSAQSTYTNGTIRYRLNTFKAKGAYVVLPSQQRTEKLPGEDVKILSSKANADLVTNRSFSETVDGIVAWYSDERERGVKLFSLRQMVGLNNGNEQKSRLDASDAGKLQDDGTDKYVGVGFEMTEHPISVNAAARSASDLWRINDSRLDILRNNGILDSSLAELHGRSEDMLNDAADSQQPMRREALNTFSFWSSRPVYLKVRSMLDDLVFAVLILLGLSVPFAFALERVIIGAVTIYKQISWFIAFFAMTFVLLYLTHPAFAIANTPIIIFLGFAIVVMSCMVIFIIMRKFEVELKAMQGMTATVHVNDVSNISTFMAAMQMGISTMRRRPTRTALTAITIILLTFTILCFASFGTQNGIVTISVAPNPKYNGAFVHNVNWNPLSEDLKDMITYSRAGEGESSAIRSVCKRLWISPKTQDNPGLLISRADGTLPTTIRGVLGIEPQELNEREEFMEYFQKIDDDSILITQPVAEYLKVAEGDTVVLKGHTFKVGKIFDNVRVSAAKDMDTSSILPADFTEMTANQPVSSDNDEEMDAMSQRNWSSIPVDQVVIVSANNAKLLGANLYALVVYTNTTQQAISIAEELARVLNIPIPATRENGVERHLLGSVLKASGAKDLFFPIVLGGLVIFGTMLGSVADRKKEIYTFSALGLAPKHVATLFFAESMVYALIGGLGGYLLAQGTLKILGFLAEYGIVRVPEMNMSSTNTIVTILIVMATVLISSIYPAIKASKSANPGLMRTWRPPKPDGDVMDLVFPFTVSQYDITGVLSFLKEHFANHTDTGLGQFMTSNVELVKEKDAKELALGLDAKLALAPFDLGVSQNFSLRSAPSEIEGIDEVRVILTRASGQPKDWQRLNKVFLDDLRQQFLIWRSVPKDTMEMYRHRTLTSIDGIVEVVTPPKKADATPDAKPKA